MHLPQDAHRQLPVSDVLAGTHRRVVVNHVHLDLVYAHAFQHQRRSVTILLLSQTSEQHSGQLWAHFPGVQARAQNLSQLLRPRRAAE
eukprot:CAMPEP_0115138276 /NCGR_PEP_ID=MMETSP0227-20121206/57557_1 /TAXON_ID=89957 /ORGANISM="Polarella glacialis, Strain CCMP 1383" /LENGTH=87 /DNA_ID=CAMNT_0002545839 /DNA_START=10 /DNA_END=270 /DNA_ORIENTATION=-